MKSIQSRSIASKFFIAVSSLMIIFYFSSCASKMAFLDSSIVPGAGGTVKVKKDNNKNYGIKIELSNLAAPTKLQPSKTIYVVWMESSDNNTKNIGQINSSTSFLSNKRKASFETVSSIKPTKIFITAEDESGIQYPGNQIVLTTNDF
jgi:hypothetical protein